MRILYITTVPAPYKVDLFEEMGKSCELTVLFETDREAYRNGKWMRKQFSNFKAVFMKGIKFGRNVKFCPSVVKYLSSKKYDMIVIGVYSTPTEMLAIEYMRWHGISFVISSDGGLIKEDSKLRKRFKSHFIGSAAWWMSTGKQTSLYLEYYGAKPEKIYTYPFTSLRESDLIVGKNIQVKDKMAKRKELNMKEDYIILSVGRFSYQKGYGKGYDVLMNAAERFPENVGIYIVGDEPTEEFINWKTKRNLGQIHFVGFKNKEELADYYIAADVFVLMTVYDVWGLVINEGMAYGLPIITTKKCVSGTELVYDGDNGFLVDVGDLELFCNRLEILLSDPEKLKRFGKRSIEIISTFTVEKAAWRHIDLFNIFLEQLKNERECDRKCKK